MRESAYLSLGANLGDREATLARALELCGTIEGTRLAARSDLYRTEPVGFTDQPEFLNCAAILETSLDPHHLLRELRTIEHRLGRVERQKWHEREIDIDIVLFGAEVIRSEDLILPHPEMERRRFVLAPLAEIAPDAIHPLLGMSVRDLLEACPDTSRVERSAWSPAHPIGRDHE